METTGKVLLAAAAVLVVIGLGALVLARLGVDRLPLTIDWKPSENVRVFVPIGLMIVALDRRHDRAEPVLPSLTRAAVDCGDSRTSTSRDGL